MNDVHIISTDLMFVTLRNEATNKIEMVMKATKATIMTFLGFGHGIVVRR